MGWFIVLLSLDQLQKFPVDTNTLFSKGHLSLYHRTGDIQGDDLQPLSESRLFNSISLKGLLFLSSYFLSKIAA